VKKAHSNRVKKVRRRSKLLTAALNSELVDAIKQDGDKSFEQRRRIHQEALSLEFIAEQKTMTD
jgi:hypothetical protein